MLTSIINFSELHLIVRIVLHFPQFSDEYSVWWVGHLTVDDETENMLLRPTPTGEIEKLFQTGPQKTLSLGKW